VVDLVDKPEGIVVSGVSSTIKEAISTKIDFL
jgi:hypothetical protein